MSARTKMTIDCVKPPNELDLFIHSIWLIKNTTTTTIQSTIIPDGYFKIVIELKNEQIDQLKLIGFFNTSIDTIMPGNVKTFMIKFKFLAAEYLFQRQLGDLLNSKETLDASFWDFDKISTESLQTFVPQLETKINSILKERAAVLLKKKQLSNLIYTTYNTNAVLDIVSQIDWSQRQINRYLKRYTGISIKEHINMLKCADSYKQISEGDFFPQGNYTDQSHFSKSIKKHTGVSPKKLNEHQDDQFIQLKITDKP